MRVDEFKSKVTNKKIGDSAIISFDDVYGYEGEVCGVLIYNSGYSFKGMNEDLDFKYVLEK